MEIAIVDDLEYDCGLLSRIIHQFLESKQIACQIQTFSNGYDFLQSFTPSRYFAVFLDIWMEGISGNVTYAEGFAADRDVYDEALAAEAVEAAKKADKAVIFAGLPDSFESEGYDRTHMQMPKSQNHLIEEIVKVQPNVVVVLHNGSPVEMPWISKVKGVLEAYLGGEAVGEAGIPHSVWRG